MKLTADIPTEPVNGVYRINSLCLPVAGIVYLQTDLAIVTGWGLYNRYNWTHRPKVLRAGVFKLNPYHVDPVAFGNCEMEETYVCSCNTTETDGIYPGDSGGPMFQYVNGRGVIIGVSNGYITSEESEYCAAREYYAFARVAKYIDWINETIYFN